MTVPIIILAAGASSRMRGADKMLEDVDGTPLIRRQVQMALGFSDQVYVTLPVRPHPRHDALEGLDVTRVEVENATAGMSASLKAGFAALPETAQSAMLLLGDLPEITSDDLRCIADAKTLFPDKLIWRGATHDGKPGHPILFDRTMFAQFAMLAGDTGAKDIIRLAGDKAHFVPLPDTHARMDLDTPEDWTAWRKRRT